METLCDCFEKLFQLIKPTTAATTATPQWEDVFRHTKHLLQGKDAFTRFSEQQVQPYLHRFFQTTTPPEFILLILEQFYEASKSELGIKFLRDNGHVANLPPLLLGENIAIAEHTENILVNISLFSEGCTVLFESIFPQLKEKAQLLKNEGQMTLLFRILSVFARVSAQKEENFVLMLSSSCVNLIIQQLDLNDPLELLNTLTLIQTLCHKVHGLCHLLESGILQNLLEIVKKEDDGAGNLVSEKIIQLFLTILRQGEAFALLLHKLPLIDVLTTKLSVCPEIVIPLFGAMGRSKVGLEILLKNSTATTSNEIIESISELFNSSTSEIKISILEAYTEMMEQRYSMSLEESGYLQNLFTSLSTDPPTIEVLLDNLKKPFYEIRKAAYAVLYGICLFQWGIMAIVSTPNTVELLLNRKAEVEPEGHSWKFSILQRISENKESKTLVGRQTYYSIVEYLKEGVIYVPAQSMPKVKEEVW